MICSFVSRIELRPYNFNDVACSMEGWNLSLEDQVQCQLSVWLIKLIQARKNYVKSQWVYVSCVHDVQQLPSTSNIQTVLGNMMARIIITIFAIGELFVWRWNYPK